jgi:hypothetical protein
MPAVAVAEQMHQGTGQDEEDRPPAEQMCAVLGEQIESGSSDEQDKSDSLEKSARALLRVVHL